MLTLHKRANFWGFITLNLFFCGCPVSNQTDSIDLDSSEKQSQKKPFRILILGDSLTEGYGVSPNQCYPFLLEEKLNADNPSGQPFYEVLNGGVTGSTTNGGASRIEWHMQSPPDFLIIALGGNDGLRGIPAKESKQNLKKIIMLAQQKKVPTMLAGMKLPPNYGPLYPKEFAQIFSDLAEEMKVPLIPFLLEGVGGNPMMNLPDRIHPNSEGHKVICENVYQHLIKYLYNN